VGSEAVRDFRGPQPKKPLNGALNNFEASNDRIENLFEHLVLQLIRSELQGRDEEIRFSVYLAI
jgi:hypothetical protein